MRRIWTIFCFGVLTGFILFSLPLTAPSIAQRNQSSSLDEQALGEANRFFSRMYVKCGEYYYYKYNREMSFMYQCKYSPSFAAIGKTHQPRRLSEADRLNGVDPMPIAWEGYASINLGLCRQQSYYQKDEPGYSAWGQWSDRNDDALPLTNRKGRWYFYNEPIGGELATKKVIVPLTCNAVPSATRSAPVKPPYWGGQYRDGHFLRIPASFGEWISLGKGPISISLPSSFSTIFIDGTNNTRTPLGQAHFMGAQITSPDALAPGLMLGAIILKIGENGEPIQPFKSTSRFFEFRIDSNDEVFLATNDSNHSDNRGEHIVIVEGRNLSLGRTLGRTSVATISPTLSVPQLVSPIDGAVFDLYPRRTRLEWQPVAGAVQYVVEIDWFSNGTGWVCPDQPGNRSVGCQLVRVTSTEYTFDFLGMTQGRWRVSAINASGPESNKSPWRTFKYTR